MITTKHIIYLTIVLTVGFIYNRWETKQMTKPEKELNSHVLEFCVPNIMTNIKQYIGYIKDVNAPRAVMENPIDTTTRGNQLEYNMGFINFN